MKKTHPWIAEHRSRQEKSRQLRQIEEEATRLRYRVREVLYAYVACFHSEPAARMTWAAELERLSDEIYNFGHACIDSVAAKAMIAYYRVHDLSAWHVDADSTMLELAHADLTWCAMATLEATLKQALDEFYADTHRGAIAA